MPAPPIVPWEQLIAGTTTLATIGGIQAWRENVSFKAEGKNRGDREKRE
jgi:hypothetical protein